LGADARQRRGCRQPTNPGVALHFKQWGEWAPSTDQYIDELVRPLELNVDFSKLRNPDVIEANGWAFVKAGKKASGRLLDGREWNELPRR
jgi:protein gp37